MKSPACSEAFLVRRGGALLESRVDLVRSSEYQLNRDDLDFVGVSALCHVKSELGAPYVESLAISTPAAGRCLDPKMRWQPTKIRRGFFELTDVGGVAPTGGETAKAHV